MVSTPEHESNSPSLSTQGTLITPSVTKTLVQGQNSASVEPTVDSEYAGSSIAGYPYGKPNPESDLGDKNVQMLLEEDGYTSEQLAEISPEQVQHALRNIRQRQQEMLEASLRDLGLNDTVRTKEPELRTPRAGPDEEEEIRRLVEEAQLKKNLGDAYISPKQNPVNMQASGPVPDLFDIFEDDDNDENNDNDGNGDDNDSAHSQDDDDRSTNSENLDDEDVGHSDEEVLRHNQDEILRRTGGERLESNVAEGADVKDGDPQAVNCKVPGALSKDVKPKFQGEKSMKAPTWAEIVSRGTSSGNGGT
jgi:hypothetical protein